MQNPGETQRKPREGEGYTHKKIHHTMGDILLWGRLGDGKPVVPQDHKAPAQSIGDLNHSVLKALASRYAANNIRDAGIAFVCSSGDDCDVSVKHNFASFVYCYPNRTILQP